MRLSQTHIFVALVCVALACPSCGAKTGLNEDLADGAPPPCENDCPGSTFCAPSCWVEDVCVELDPPDCDDDDPCTVDFCDTDTDSCFNSVELADEDDDTHGVPLECGGTDCDDTDPLIYPGAQERCNGLDDDCDGLIDEGADLLPSGAEILVDGSETTDSAASVVWTGENYIMGYWDYRDGDADVYLQRLDPEGIPYGDEEVVTTAAGDGFGPSIVWTGWELGAAWSDRRDGNYEIYFARFTAELERLSADVRLTNDDAWSVYPKVAWGGTEYAVVWQDERDMSFEVYARRVGPEGPIGGATRLSALHDGEESEAPVITSYLGQGYHVAWIEGSLDQFEVVHVRLVDGLEIETVNELSRSLGGTAASPEITAGPETVAVIWEQEYAHGFDTEVAVLSQDGDLIRPAAAMQDHNMTAREGSALWVNSGFLIVWAGFDPLTGGSFDLYYSVVSPEGDPLLSAEPVSGYPGDAIGPHLALGPGEVGVAWSDSRSGSYDAYFTRLLCAGLSQ